MPANLEQTLLSHFGMPQFRAGQKEIISSILAQKDVLAVLPTGGGKSLCYQLPAVELQKLVVVVSPLIALMKDQVASLQRLKVPSGAIFSGQTEDQKRAVFAQIQKGGAFVLYLSPERVQKEGFQRWIQTQKLALFAIDEAHCVSQWGHDFRAEYGELKILKKLRPDVPTLALTASATPTVLEDISKQLQLNRPDKRVHGFYRPNLYFQVDICEDEEQKFDILVQAIKQTLAQSVSQAHCRILVYCGTRKMTQEVATNLQQQFDSVDFYHAGLGTEVRNKVQAAYIQGNIQILVATNAFGMGIDQPNVRLVVHFQMPANIDSLSQEMGRAGRDGLPSTCIMLYAAKDKGLQSYFIQNSEASAELKKLRWKNLDALVNYAEGGECRHAEILTYYKDAQRIQHCGHCDVCAPLSERRVMLKSRGAKAKVESWFKSESSGKSSGKTKKSKAPSFADGQILDPQQLICFEALKAWRKQKSKELDTPAFIIFSDKTLRQLAQAQPLDPVGLQKIYGIGEEKCERFGTEIISVIRSVEI